MSPPDKEQGRPGGVVEYQYTRKKIDKIPQNTPNSSKYTQEEFVSSIRHFSCVMLRVLIRTCKSEM